MTSTQQQTVPPTSSWFVYMVQCVDDTLYTGITTDLMRRLAEHNMSIKGAKYTRARRPVSLVYSECYRSRSEASKREAGIKKLNVTKKRALILKAKDSTAII